MFGRTPCIFTLENLPSIKNFYQSTREQFGRYFVEESQSVKPTLWMPKTTLCWKDVSYEIIGNIIIKLRQIDFCHRMNVTELLVLSCDENGENEFDRFTLTPS